MSDKQKVFDDFPKVDCSECEHYYTNACDGVSKGSQKPCKTFLATRSVDILLQIKSIRTKLEWLTRVVVILQVILILHLVGHILNLY